MDRAVFNVDYNLSFNAQAAEAGDISSFTAEEYLAWVVHQAKSLPDVVRVGGDDDAAGSQIESHIIQAQTPNPVVYSALPESAEIEWERELVLRFRELCKFMDTRREEGRHERIVKVPAMKDSRSWQMFCLGYKMEGQLIDDDVESLSDEEAEHDDDIFQEIKRRRLELSNSGSWEGATAVVPSIDLLLQFDQVLTQRLLLMQIGWCCQSSIQIDKRRGLWLFALLSNLETPLFRDTVAGIRSLYKRCKELREMLPTGNRDDATSAVNVLISITGNYFKQGEEYLGLSN